MGFVISKCAPIRCIQNNKIPRINKSEAYKMDTVRNRSAYGRYRIIVMNEIFRVSAIIRFVMPTSPNHQLLQLVKLWEKKTYIFHAVLN
jgi:hypothetical protein